MTQYVENNGSEPIDVEAKVAHEARDEHYEHDMRDEDVYRTPESDVTPPSSATVTSGLTTVSWISYVLHFVVALAAVFPSLQASVFLLLLAFILDLVKKKDAEGTWQESHFDYRISSVIWAGVWYALTAPLWLLLVLPGMVAWALVSLWFLYRIVKGMLALSGEKAVES